jgi:hypothetical protein
MKQNLKNLNRKYKFIILVFLVLVSSSASEAAGILAICSTSVNKIENCPNNRLFFPTYRSTSGITEFKYRIDQGAIGAISSEEAVTITDSILSQWSDESSLDFVKTGTGFLDTNVNANNFSPYLEPSNPLGYSPVIWDEDGSIIEELYGVRGKQQILGFAGATCFHSSGIGVSCKGVSGNVNRIIESQTVLNGFLFTGSNKASIIKEFKLVLLHEFAHMFGIDHSQGGDVEAFNVRSGNYNNIPVMFPFAINPLEELQQDDIAAVRLAYPLGDENTKFGTIKGQLLKSGSLLKGANIIAYKVDENNPRKLAVASASNSDGKGNFVMPGLIPGEYIVMAEPINSSFKSGGGSSIGLHDPISAGAMNSGFYNGDGEAIINSTNLSTGLAQAKRININAGQTVTINFETSVLGEDVSFLAKGRAFNGVPVPTRPFKPRAVRARLINQFRGDRRSLSFETDYPSLIEFRPSSINFRKRFRVIRIRLASFFEFLNEFPELLDNGFISIPVTIRDSSTGYEDTVNLFIE